MALDREFTADTTRTDRCGFPEVIYAEGKTPEQVVNITLELLDHADVVLATRANEEHASQMRSWFGEELQWFERAGVLVVDRRPDGISSYDLDALVSGASGGEGNILVCCAGTSDLPVAEEAALTARIMGSCAHLLADVGVAGVHRVLDQQDMLDAANAIIVVAGMEGALPTLVAGLVDVPVIAVPTSVGYGASFGGVAALLGMLNSCAGGVSVVNIDNGFGAGQIADRINRPRRKNVEEREEITSVPASTPTYNSMSSSQYGSSSQVTGAIDPVIADPQTNSSTLFEVPEVEPATEPSSFSEPTPVKPERMFNDGLDIPSFEENPAVLSAEDEFEKRRKRP